MRTFLGAGRCRSFIRSLANASCRTCPPILQVNVLAYEYSGYGKSEGTVSEDNCYADIRAAYDYLTTQKQIPSEQIVL